MTSYLRVFFKDFRNSFILSRGVGYSIAFDFLFLLSVVVFFYYWASSVISKAQDLNNIDYSSITEFNKEGIATITSSLNDFLVYMLLFVLLFFIFFILVFSISQSFIWFSYSKKKKTLRIFTKIFFLNFLILTPGILTLLFSFLKYEKRGLFLYIIIFVLMMHFVGIANLHFAYHHRFRRSIYKIFEHGILKFHHFVLPYLLIVIVFLLVRYVFKTFLSLNSLSNITLFFVIILIFSAYIRNYFVAIAKREVKHA